MHSIQTATIENVVVSSSIEREIDLDQLGADLPGAVYDPEKFPGLIYRLRDPKAAILLFRTGNLVCTGPDSESRARTAIEEFLSKLADLGISVPEDPVTVVVNVVGSGDLGGDLDLNAVAVGLGFDYVEYDPEQFPGLVYRLTDPAIVVLLFGSGKCVVTGATSPAEVSRAFERVSDELASVGLL